MFRLETHAHTAESSRCGKVPAAGLVEEIQKSGYDGVVITDHFNHYYLDDADLSWEQKVDRYLIGYRAAREAGKALGIRVYCGIEFRTTENENDYLVYGVTPELLYRCTDLYLYSMEELRALADREGLLIVQAHPFRTGMFRENPALLDGVEVFNGNARHNSHNDLALQFARENGLQPYSGSDHHQTEDRGRGGMVLPREPEDEADLVRLLPRAGLLPDLLSVFFPPQAE